MQFRLALVIAMVAAASARAGSVEPDPRADDAFDFMNVLARRHSHDLNDERWNVYGQLTFIDQEKLPFHAAYTNFGQPTCDTGFSCGNSLSPRAANSFTATLTLYGGVKLWHGAEFWITPELLSELPFDDLTGLSAVQNFELQKGGNPTPAAYIARAYLSQTIDLGCDKDVLVSNPFKLGKKLAKRRVVLTLGRFSVIDFFDTNTYAGDLRRQLMNISFMTYGAFDFTADTRGYTFGGVAELYFDDWEARIGHTAPPKLPNRSDLDFSFGVLSGKSVQSPGGASYGDQIELVHHHVIDGQAGAVRVLGYRNVEYMGRFADAVTLWNGDPITFSAANVGTSGAIGTQCELLGGNGAETGAFANHISRANAPDLCWARRLNTKLGIGINVEQAVAKEIGVFLRAMFADGQTEVQAYLPTDRSLSFGALARGGRWGRRNDYAGVGFSAGWISKEHADYYRLGGIDGFVGDGKLNQAAELVAEGFYGANLTSSIWVSGDYQIIGNPGFNADRGPVHVLGGRFHVEF